MKRRRFFVTTGTGILGATAFNSLNNKPSIAVEFELDPVPDKKPGNIDSVLIQFSKFNLVPRYIDFSKDITIDTTVTVDGEEEFSSDSVSVKDKKLINKNDINPQLTVDVSTSEESIDGSIEILVKHDSIGEKKYRRLFRISNNPLTDGLVLYYPMEKGVGSTVEDSVGSNDGDVNGATWSNNSVIGDYSLDFDGSSDYVNVNYGNGSEIIYTDWTVSGWINVFNWSDSNRKEWLSVTENRTTSRPLDFVHQSGSIKHYRGEAAGEVMSHDVSTKNGWHHMAVTQNRIDSSTVKLKMYFNGQRKDSVKADYENMRPSYSFNVGRSIQGDLHWNGKIDDVRIYDRTLPKEEVNKLYNLGV